MRSRCVLVLLAAAAGCGGGLRAPPTGPRPTDAVPIAVDYPPPPAQIDKIECDPGKPCVWIDGTYAWVARRWEWQEGRWVEPTPGCYYRSPTLVWAPGAQGPGTLYYFAPRWYQDEAGKVTECKAPPPCSKGPKCSGTLGEPRAPAR